jgi:hypothetical protein
MLNRSAILWAACATAIPSIASARLLFKDDFESSPASPFTLQQQRDNAALRGDFDPINTNGAPGATVPGQWFHYAKTSPGSPDYAVQVTNNVENLNVDQNIPISGSYQGNNVMRLHRVKEPPSSSATMGAYIGPQTSGVVRAKWLEMFPAQNFGFEFGITFPAHFFFTPWADNDHSEGTTGGTTQIVLLDSPLYTPESWARAYINGGPGAGGGSIELNHPSAPDNDPLVEHSKWQQWEMEANLDTQKFTITVDGLKSRELDFTNAGSFSTFTWRVGQAQGPDVSKLGTHFIDDVIIEKLDPRWKVDSDGTWSTATNWEIGVPNGVDSGAEFGDIITASRNVTVDGAKTLGYLSFNNADGSYSLTGSGSITFDVNTGNGTVDVLAGSHSIGVPVVMNKSLNVNSSPNTTLTTATIAATPTADFLTKTGAGTLIAQNVRVNGLNINGGVLKIAQGATANLAAGTSSTKPLAILGGAAAPQAKLDLTNNTIVVDYTEVNPLGEIRQFIQAGRANGAWTGNGISSSTAALVALSGASHRTALGYAEASALPTSTFGDVTADSTAVVVRYTYEGDADLDGIVSTNDFTLLSANFNAVDPGWVNGDFNYDGRANALDFNAIAANFGQNIALASTPLGSVVPEPTVGLSVLGFAVLGLARRRMNRC